MHNHLVEYLNHGTKWAIYTTLRLLHKHTHTHTQTCETTTIVMTIIINIFLPGLPGGLPEGARPSQLRAAHNYVTDCCITEVARTLGEKGNNWYLIIQAGE